MRKLSYSLLSSVYMWTSILLLAALLGDLANWSYSTDALGADAAPLAWFRVEEKTQEAQQYKGTPYIWLGRATIQLTIDVAPSPNHILELLWGAKNDMREGAAIINGVRVKLRQGGYDGYQPLRLPMPAKVAGERYEITLKQAYGKAGFIAELRLIAGGDPTIARAVDLREQAYKISLKTTPPSRPPVFPEMQAIWDKEPAPPAAPLADDRQEAAFRRAEHNARQANESFFRCRRFIDGWLAQADPKTGLIPRNLSSGRDIWNAQDAAADNYPFMVLTAAITDRPLFNGRMLDMLRTETKLTSRVDRLPDTWSFSKQAFQSEKPNMGRIIFGSSEYVKDGLLPLTEWLGASPWSERMLGIVDDIWKHAPVKTPYGNIPSTNVEINGEQLQSLSRLYWMTGAKKYLHYAIRLGDYYLLGDHHPTRNFKSLRLRDHGCEVVSGLCELYAAVNFAAPEKKKAYKEPIHAICDRILEIGRNEFGMLYNTINPQTGEHHQGICDTWGYNYNGIYTVYMIDNTEAYREAVRKALSNLKEHLTTYHWGSADEYADSIEGAINLYNREPIASAADWIDSEIKDMWSPQRPNGVIEGWHGDGNSARTAIMYALWKTQGITTRPWRSDVRFGAVRENDVVYVSLIADKAWEGKLLFDKERHKVLMRLPLDYPRINQFPEWFTTEAEKRYAIRRAPDGSQSTLTGKQLQDGMDFKLEPGVELRLLVTVAR